MWQGCVCHGQSITHVNRTRRVLGSGDSGASLRFSDAVALSSPRAPAPLATGELTAAGEEAPALPPAPPSSPCCCCCCCCCCCAVEAGGGGAEEKKSAAEVDSEEEPNKPMPLGPAEGMSSGSEPAELPAPTNAGEGDVACAVSWLLLPEEEEEDDAPPNGDAPVYSPTAAAMASRS